jgi:hypothetical protein
MGIGRQKQPPKPGEKSGPMPIMDFRQRAYPQASVGNDRLARQVAVLDANHWREITQAPMPCKWAQFSKFAAATIVQPKGKAWFDIAFVSQGDDRLRLHNDSTPHGVQDELQENRRYRFRITVDAQSAPVDHLEIEVDWKTNLDVSAKRTNAQAEISRDAAHVILSTAAA